MLSPLAGSSTGTQCPFDCDRTSASTSYRHLTLTVSHYCYSPPPTACVSNTLLRIRSPDPRLLHSFTLGFNSPRLAIRTAPFVAGTVTLPTTSCCQFSRHCALPPDHYCAREPSNCIESARLSQCYWPACQLLQVDNRIDTCILARRLTLKHLSVHCARTRLQRTPTLD